MRKIIFLLWVAFVIFILREASSVDEDEARQFALEILSEQHSNNICGWNFEKYLEINYEFPLGISQPFNIDTSWYTFESNNGRCTILIYIYKYWWGYEYALDPH